MRGRWVTVLFPDFSCLKVLHLQLHTDTHHHNVQGQVCIDWTSLHCARCVATGNRMSESGCETFAFGACSSFQNRSLLVHHHIVCPCMLLSHLAAVPSSPSTAHCSCTLPVPFLYPSCTLPVPFRYPSYTPPVPFLYPSCTLLLPFLSPSCNPPVPVTCRSLTHLTPTLRPWCPASSNPPST